MSSDAPPPGESASDAIEELVEDFILARLREEDARPEDWAARLRDPGQREEALRRMQAFLHLHEDLTRRGKRGDLPEEIAGFAILEELGRGGMGVVYRARQVALDREVALKVLPPLDALDPHRVERFLREASALAALRHPGIVSVLTAGEEGGLLYFAMEMVVGLPLDQVLERAADLPEESRNGAAVADWLEELGVDAGDLRGQSWNACIAGLGKDLAEALDFAHQRGIAHRDLKPANVLLTTGGKGMLIDFGLAQLSTAGESLTRSADLLGTPRYLPPERVRRLEGVRAEAGDLYSLGVILYEALAGVPPFRAEALPKLAQQIERGMATPLRRLQRNVPRDLATIVHCCMETEPDRRYASASALAEDLRRFLGFRPIQARPPGIGRRLGMLVRRHPGRTAAALALALVPLALAGFRSYEIHRSVELLRTAVEASDLPAAEAALQRLVGLDENHSSRRPLEAGVDLLRCARSLAAAATSRRSLLDLRQEFAGLLPELGALQARSLREYLPPEIHARKARLEHRREELAVALRKTRAEVLNHLWNAEALALRAGRQDYGPVAAAFADFYFGEWGAAQEAGDLVAAAVYRTEVERYDHAGRHRAALLGLGTLAVEGPPDAMAWLFRYIPERQVRADAWSSRRIPVPAFRSADGSEAAPAGLRPGDTCLVLQRPAPLLALEQGDVLLSIGGSPAGSGLWVAAVEPGSAGERAGVRPFDRLLEVNGRDIRSYRDLALVQHLGGEYEVVLERRGEPLRLAAPPAAQLLDATGILVVSAPELLAEVPPPEAILLEVLRGEEVLAVELEAGNPPHLVAGDTAYPLLRVASALLGPLPIEPRQLEPGSYLLLVRKPGCAELRVPFLLPREGLAELVAEPVAGADPPPGAVWIPPGTLTRGDDEEATYPAAPGEVEVAGFWMARREVTIGDWEEFLADPEVAAGIEAERQRSGLWTRVMRSSDSSRPIRYSRHYRRLFPVSWVTLQDIEAFLAWKNQRLEASGSPWRVGLPTGAEWERAARGADRRAYPWGDGFEPLLCRGHLSQQVSLKVPILTHPGDESPFGVRDMAGSVSEWVADSLVDPGSGATAGPEVPRAMHGGSYAAIQPGAFRIQSRGGDLPTVVYPYAGMRLVFRRTQVTKD